MEAKITLPQELIDEIIEGLFTKIKPLITKNGRSDDTIFDVKGLCKYLSVSDKWVYERTHLKEIPHLKVQGLLRFRKRDIDKWLDSFKMPNTSTPKPILRAINKNKGGMR